MKTLGKIIVLLVLCTLITSCEDSNGSGSNNSDRILVFSKTLGFRHKSIKAGKQMFRQLAKTHNIKVTFTENVQYFTDDSLRQYESVVFLSTTGNLFNNRQQIALQRYIQAGGGFLGIHAASGTEYKWPWYGRLVGAYFKDHPTSQQQRATIIIPDTTGKATKGLPSKWIHVDEWYNFKHMSPNIHVLGYVDERTYSGGTYGVKHPIFWRQKFDGGRSFYTALGHFPSVFRDSTFIQHIWDGLTYTMGNNQPLNYKGKNVRPHLYQLKKTTLIGQPLIKEPISLAIADNGNVFVASRRGQIMVYHPKSEQAKVIGKINAVHYEYDGLVGMTLDPDFSNNRWLYVYYPTRKGKKFIYHLSRFTLDDQGMLVESSEKRLLNIPYEKNPGNHTGGDLAFDSEGNLYLSTGDNTNPWESNGYAPIDERKGRTIFDAQRTAGNTNDLRGKILRIHPNDDGSYSIPDGNLFSRNQKDTRPEIYIMGNRNPFRISVDFETNWLYWGDVGPDALRDSLQGPKGYDEINQAKQAGNYGWPYFIANNKAYVRVNFGTGKVGNRFDPDAPVNNSFRNDGLKKLPPARKAFIWYPYSKSKKFPALGTGGRTAMAGPVYHFDEHIKSSIKLPAYYDEALFIYDFMRNWIKIVRINTAGDYKYMETFMPTTSHSIIDMQFGPKGSLYVLDYGSVWLKANQEAKLSRITYHQFPNVNNSTENILSKAETKPSSGSGIITKGKKLISKNNCKSCHALNAESIGPSFLKIAQKYPQNQEIIHQLSAKIMRGGSGNWGQQAMPPHPHLTKKQVQKMVKYILSLSKASSQ